MSGTHVYYNGVLMRDCETLDYSCVLEFDETGTHEKYMVTRITVASTLLSLYKKGVPTPMLSSAQHRSTINIFPVLSSSGSDGTGTDETTPARMEEIMQRLSEPRKDFWYAVNGVLDPAGSGTPNTVPGSIPSSNRNTPSTYNSYRLILVATGEMPTVSGSVTTNEYVKFFSGDLTVKRVDVLDANNGPKPSNLGLVQLYGGNVVRVQATFEICRVLSKTILDADNPDPGYDAQKVRGVVSNTWNIVDSLDDDGAVTHNITGKLVVKDQRYKANGMRMFAFPLAFPYARLVNRQYTVSESGLVLAYQYQFKHAGAAPPPGVRKYEATYTELSSYGGDAAGVYRGSMSIKVMGWHDRNDHGAPLLEREKKQKVLLIRGAHTLLRSRITGINKAWLPLPGQLAKGTTVLESKIIERVGLPELEMQWTIRYGSSSKEEFYNRTTNMGNAIDILNYDPRWWPIDNEWGRLPAGTGSGNLGDNDNPEFTNPGYPYADSGDPLDSDYFSGYFQPPGSNRHTLPRITGLSTYNKIDTSKEWARPAGSVSGDALSAPAIVENETANPMSGPSMNATPSHNLTGAVELGPLPPVENDAFTGIASVQDSGFQYIAWSSEVMNDSSQGKILLPLSVPRNIPIARRAQLLGILVLDDASSTSGKECSVPVQLCAPVSQRVYSVSTTRSQKWGEIPEPKTQIVRTSGSGSTQKITNIETLISKEFLGETPVLNSDGITREFTSHARYVYGLSNPWRGTLEEGGGDEFEKIPVGESPVDKALASQNAIVVKGNVNTLSPLFNETQPQYG